VLDPLVPDLIGDDVAEHFPCRAVELHQLHLFDREEVVGHLSEIHVGVGDVVRIGQVIGAVGSTGRTYITKTRIDGDAVDPQKFMRARVRRSSG
jgi:hypothetical protein